MSRIIDAFTQFFDGAGKPLANGWLNFYESGTVSTDKDTYSDSTLTTPNANPLQLDAEGRCPDVFGEGVYKVVLSTNDPLLSAPSVVVDTFDPVGVLASTVPFSEWDAAATYSVNEIVLGSDGNFYKALLSNNTNHNPTSSATYWEQINFKNTWNSTVTYSVDEVVQGSDGLEYIAVAESTNQDPTSTSGYWRLLDFPDISGGDAGKIVRVNDDEDSYELTDGITINSAGTAVIGSGLNLAGNSIVTSDGGTTITSADLATIAGGVPPVKYHIDGLVLSNDTDADHDINITAGEATNAVGDERLTLASEITKQIDASWALGDDAGGLSSSLTVANSTWYAVHLIKVGGSVDVGFDTSATAANLITDHSATAYRRIGWVLTDGSANILGFTDLEVGPTVKREWNAFKSNFATSSPTSRTLCTVTVPVGCVGEIFARASENGTGYFWVRSTNFTDTTPDATNCDLAILVNGREVCVSLNLIVDNNNQIAHRGSTSSDFWISTTGYTDNRR